MLESLANTLHFLHAAQIISASRPSRASRPTRDHSCPRVRSLCQDVLRRILRPATQATTASGRLTKRAIHLRRRCRRSLPASFPSSQQLPSQAQRPTRRHPPSPVPVLPRTSRCGRTSWRNPVRIRSLYAIASTDQGTPLCSNLPYRHDKTWSRLGCIFETLPHNAYGRPAAAPRAPNALSTTPSAAPSPITATPQWTDGFRHRIRVPTAAIAERPPADATTITPAALATTAAAAEHRWSVGPLAITPEPVPEEDSRCLRGQQRSPSPITQPSRGSRSPPSRRVARLPRRPADSTCGRPTDGLATLELPLPPDDFADSSFASDV